jgi:NitT/TauT family transport system substrate-binding protein
MHAHIASAGKRLRPLLFLIALGIAACSGESDRNVVRIPTGAGGVGFLPLQMMREFGLIEKHARAAGIDDLEVEWLDFGGPAIVNDALLSGSVDFIAAGPPGFITLWDRTRTSVRVQGVAAITALPMYLNTRAEHLSSIDDLRETDKIAVTAIKVSIPAIVMQMYALERYGLDEVGRFDRYTVTMTHPDATVAMLSGTSDIESHFTSPPFHQREIENEAIRTIMTTTEVMGGDTTFTMLSTTSAFRESRPQIYNAVLAALEEAHELIRSDLPGAARVLIAADGGGGLSHDALVEVLDDPDISFTTTPQNTMRYAEFMHAIGSISNLPESWKDLFFPEIHSRPGS